MQKAKPNNRKDQDGLYRRDDSPYWWASFADASGRRTRRSTQTTDRKDAEALLAKWRLAAYQQKHWDKPPTHTFDELILAYLAETKDKKRSAERDYYSAKQLYPVFTGIELSQLTPSSIRDYIKSRQALNAQPSTINKELRLLSAALNYAGREWGWAIQNPVSGRTLKEPEGRVRWLSIDETDLLMAAAESEPKAAAHLPAFIQLALHTGMRKGELLGLEWDRVNFATGLILLRAPHTKNEKRRSIPINNTARAALIQRARYRATHCPDSPWVFCHIGGQRITSLRRSFDSACRRAGIVDFHIHDLRHTCAARLVSANVPLMEVRDLLGHSSITMTERYAHLAPENVRAAVAVLDNVSRYGHAHINEVNAKTR